MALGTLNADPQERVSKPESAFFRLREFTTNPVVSHRWLIREASFLLLVVIAAHTFAILGVCFIFESADGENNPFCDFVVRNVLFDSGSQPFVPVGGQRARIDSRLIVVQLPGIVSGPV